MKVQDVMSRRVLTVSPDTPVHAVAGLLSEHHVSGAPVVDSDGALLGIVTETDLAHRLAAKVSGPRSWLRALFSSAPAEALEYAKARGRTARDIMSAATITIGEEASVEDAARILEEKGVRRLPVLKERRLVGVVSRADLLRALLTPEAPGPATNDDRALREALLDALREAAWTHAYSIHFTVRSGEVTFYGFPAPTEIQRGLRVLAQGVPGVSAVHFPGTE